MSDRGRKLTTAKNASGTARGFIRRESLASPIDLAPDALVEYQRLCEVLRSRGTLDRLDLMTVAACASMRANLNRVQKVIDDLPEPDMNSVRKLAMLTMQWRGLMRELGLTLQPSRTLLRTTPIRPHTNDPIARYVKLGDNK
jgi:hypothetical protein